MPDMRLPLAHTTEFANSLEFQAQTAREESRKQSMLADQLEQVAARLRVAIKQDERNAQGKAADHE
jgi:hypothetical protein